MDLERVSVVGLLNVLPFSVLVVNGGSFWTNVTLTDVNAVSRCAAATIRYPVPFVKK